MEEAHLELELDQIEFELEWSESAPETVEETGHGFEFVHHAQIVVRVVVVVAQCVIVVLLIDQESELVDLHRSDDVRDPQDQPLFALRSIDQSLQSWFL